MASADMGVSESGWRKSTYSTQNGACVEVAVISGAVVIADTAEPGRRMLRCSAVAWRLLVADVRGGRLGKPEINDMEL